MATLKIKNFGPIEENRDFDGNLIDNGCFTIRIAPVSVFIGSQASGKSTVAKLYSLFAWLEKRLKRDSLSIGSTPDIFKNLCVQQEIAEYFHNDTYISYQGNGYVFEYDEEKHSFTKEETNNLSENYVLPKVQYVSAARNLLTILYKISFDKIVSEEGNTLDLSSTIPYMVRELNTEYLRALDKFGNEGFHLPIEGTSVFFNNHKTYIKTKDKGISMSSASSGIQSIAPLLMVSSFLSSEVKKDLFEKLKSVSSRIKNCIEKVLSEMENKELSAKFNLYYVGGKEILGKDRDVSQLEEILNQFIPSCFINIVEEPEQNLFPETQADVLYELLEYKNANANNKLVISTHSPYILTALNNAILARDVFDKTGKTLDELPENRMIAPENVSAYKFENGRIISIIDEESRLIDASQIDDCSTKINEVFDKLMDLSDE